MTQNRLPIWLSGRDRTVAIALITDGFWYCYQTDSDELLSPESVGDWLLSSAYGGDVGLEAWRDGALFYKDYFENSDALNDAEYDRVKALISQAQRAWDTCTEAGQLSFAGLA